MCTCVLVRSATSECAVNWHCVDHVNWLSCQPRTHAPHQPLYCVCAIRYASNSRAVGGLESGAGTAFDSSTAVSSSSSARYAPQSLRCCVMRCLCSWNHKGWCFQWIQPRVYSLARWLLFPTKYPALQYSGSYSCRVCHRSPRTSLYKLHSSHASGYFRRFFLSVHLPVWYIALDDLSLRVETQPRMLSALMSLHPSDVLCIRTQCCTRLFLMLSPATC